MGNNVDTIGSNKSGKNSGSVFVVDPNPPGMESIPPEDMFIYVKLSAFPRSRATFGGNSLEGDPIIFDSGVDGEVHFISTNISYKDGILDPPLQKTYATTEWTNIGGFKDEDTRSSGILEGFGINSINIKYNASLVPVVDIQFTDVRGSSLFDVVKDDDRKSPYSIFFKLPYPVFRLSVKGYFGQKVDYCLHMTNWNSEFDGSTGNFVINANFLGFQQALLNDLVIGNIIGAVNTQKGTDNLNRIFDERISEVGVENSIPLVNSDGSNIRKLDEFFTRISKIQIESEIIKTENENFAILKDLNAKLSILNSIQKFIGTPIPKETNSSYGGATEKVGESLNYLELNNSSNKITQPSSTINDRRLIKGENYVDIRDYVVFSNTNRNEFKSYIKALNNVVSQYADFSKSAKKLPNKSIKTKSPNNTLDEAKEIAENKTSKNINPDSSDNNGDKTLIETFFNIEDTDNWENFIVTKNIKNEIESLPFSEILNSFITPVENNSLYLKNDYEESSEKNALFAINLLETQINDNTYYTPNTKLNPESNVLVADFRKQREFLEKRIKDLEKDVKVLRERVENEINEELLRNFEQRFNFKPTISKCFEIIANNAQAMIETIYDISYEASQKNISENRKNILKNYETDVPQGIDISAFPTIYENGAEGLEEIYIGEVSGINRSDFPELNFVEEVFENLTSRTIEIEQVTTATNTGTGLDTDNWFPINPIDYETNPWIKLNNSDDIVKTKEELVEKFFIRLGILKNYSNFDNTTGFPTIDDYIRLDSIAANKTIFDKGARDVISNLLNELENNISILENTEFFKTNIQQIGLKYKWKEEIALPKIGDIELSGNLNKDVDFILFDKQEILNNSKQLFQKIREDSAYSKLLDNKLNNGVNKEIIDGNLFYKNLYENNNNLNTYNSYNVWDKDVATNLVKSNNNQITDNLSNSKLTDFNPSGETFLLESKFINVTNYNITNLNPSGQVTQNPTSNSSNVSVSDSLFENSMVESDLYNAQDSTYAKSLLLFSTFPFRTFGEGFLNSVFPNDRFVGARIVNLPKTYICYLGGLLWRYKQYKKNNIDPLKFGTINNKNYGENLPNNYINVGYMRKVSPEKPINIEINLLNLPNSVSNSFISYFKSWVDTNFQRFEENIKIYVPTTENSEVFSNLKKNSENYFLKILKQTSDLILLNSKVFSGLNSVQNITNLNPSGQATQNPTSNSSNIILEEDFNVSRNDIINYISIFKQKFVEVEKKNETNSKELREKIDKRNKELKLGIYNYFKNINNKWVGSEEKSFNICGGSDTKNLIDYFRFVDRGWRCIGDEATFNLNSFLSLSKDLDSSVYVFMSKILRDSNFLFQILPTYINFKSVTEVAKIFQPQTTLQNNESTGPIFCCIYIGGTSEVLDIEERGNYYFKDDSFTFKGGNELPSDFLDNGDNCSDFQENSSLVAFRVSFGAQNQNIFKNVSLNQQEHKETGEYFKALADLVDKRGATQQTYVGTDLLRIFKTRSYTCSVEALGCMNIQPLMYFDLQNVPFFNGAYLITNVTHSITPNHMTTNFQGVRQSKFISPPNTKIIADLDINLNEISKIEPIVFTNLSPNNQKYSIGVLNPDADFDFVNNFGVGGTNEQSNQGVNNFRILGVSESTFSDDELKTFLTNLSTLMVDNGIVSNSQVTMFLSAMLDNSNNFQNKELDWSMENQIPVRFPETDEQFPNKPRYYGLVPDQESNTSNLNPSGDATQNVTAEGSDVEVEKLPNPLTSQPIFGEGNESDIAYSLDITPTLSEYQLNDSIELEKQKITNLFNNSENENEKKSLRKKLKQLKKQENSLYKDTKYFNIFEGDAYRFKPRGYLYIIGRKQYYMYQKNYGNNPNLASIDETAALSTSLYIWKNFKGVGDNLQNTAYKLSSLKGNGSATIFSKCIENVYQTHSIGNIETAFDVFEKVLTNFVTKKEGSEPVQPLINYFNPGPT